MSECAVKVGMTAMFDPFADMQHSYGIEAMRGQIARGTVVYINEPHHWFSVAYGNGLRTSFHFCEIGKGHGKKVVLS